MLVPEVVERIPVDRVGDGPRPARSGGAAAGSSGRSAGRSGAASSAERGTTPRRSCSPARGRTPSRRRRRCAPRPDRGRVGRRRRRCCRPGRSVPRHLLGFEAGQHEVDLAPVGAVVAVVTHLALVRPPQVVLHLLGQAESLGVPLQPLDARDGADLEHRDPPPLVRDGRQVRATGEQVTIRVVTPPGDGRGARRAWRGSARHEDRRSGPEPQPRSWHPPLVEPVGRSAGATRAGGGGHQSDFVIVR